MKPLTASEVRELCRRFEIRPSKALGQNFIIDPNSIRKIVRRAGVGADEDVIEVGAGLGTLTSELASVARRVVAIELDRRLVEALTHRFADTPNVTILAADAMQVDYRTLTTGTAKFVANLPYNISTPLVAKILEEAPSIEMLSIMVQKEAGERLVAPPGSRTYGAISVRVAYHCSARIVASVSRSIFWPLPGV
ncbi:MAG: 16S rRNA (adenine(1518)-N(6)/adenine(1519)-N(6))-dimethyltransferase RsmA, partial [Actinobacteria bacterium]|nr:16S rRNA (adenine(1518)-N(6)/adenine(1519)-N(6))-dimethyltransferase RsmA [Actinomycetota bacterium]